MGIEFKLHPHTPDQITLPPELRKAESKFRRKQFVYICSGAIGFAVLAMLLIYMSPLYAIWDAANISPQIGTGVIETTIMRTGGRNQSTQTSWRVQLRLANQTLYVIEYQDFRPGEQVKVSYRIGRSGRYYIDWIQPMTTVPDKR